MTYLGDMLKGRFGAPLYLDRTLFIVVAGAWAETPTASQTKWHHGFMSQAGVYENWATHNDNDEIKIPNLKLKPSRWKVTVVLYKSAAAGIMEVLHGAVSMGTFDTYDANPVFNVVADPFFLNLTTETVADLRIKLTGKNGASSNHILAIASVKIEQVLADVTT